MLFILCSSVTFIGYALCSLLLKLLVLAFILYHLVIKFLFLSRPKWRGFWISKACNLPWMWTIVLILNKFHVYNCRNCVESLYELELNMSLTRFEGCSVDFGRWSHSAIQLEGSLETDMSLWSLETSWNHGFKSSGVDAACICAKVLVSPACSWKEALEKRTIKHQPSLLCVGFLKVSKWFGKDKALPWGSLVLIF